MDVSALFCDLHLFQLKKNGLSPLDALPSMDLTFNLQRQSCIRCFQATGNFCPAQSWVCSPLLQERPLIANLTRGPLQSLAPTIPRLLGSAPCRATVRSQLKRTVVSSSGLRLLYVTSSRSATRGGDRIPFGQKTPQRKSGRILHQQCIQVVLWAERGAAAT